MFLVNELVLGYRKEVLTEAMVLKTKTLPNLSSSMAGSPDLQYLIHYKGCQQKWDEWVPEQRLVKFKPVKGAGSAASQKGKAKRGTKRARGDDADGPWPKMKLVVPPALKAILIDDWEFVARDRKLISLPCSPTVMGVLKEFAARVKSTSPNHLKEPTLIVDAVVEGIQIYFDRGLGKVLLYGFEREQYEEVRDRYWAGEDIVFGSEKEMSDIYGAEHLLRLLVKLPELWPVEMDAESTQIAAVYINELIQYMAQEKARFFQAEYENAPPQYQGMDITS